MGKFLGDDESFPEVVRRFKRSIVESSLLQSGGSVTEAAKLLGIARDAMKHLMKTFGFGKNNFNRSLRH
jgi:DNA-binding NtrC family response regulator